MLKAGNHSGEKTNMKKFSISVLAARLAIMLTLFAVMPSVVAAGPPPNPTSSDGALNTAGGTGVLLNNSGVVNTGFGAFALTDNTSGSANTATGDQALAHNTTGSDNTRTGGFALFANTTGSNNTATGFEALEVNS